MSAGLSLILNSQVSPLVEPKVEDGEPVTLHYVVKRTPFPLTFSVPPGQTHLDFFSSALRCRLLFNRPKHDQVDSGLSFVARPSPDGLSCVIDVKILVLSSQQQHSSFVVETTLSNPQGDTVTTLSDPIICVSKQQQIRNQEAIINGAAKGVKPPTKKRVRSEDLLVSLERILSNQRIQLDNQEKILHRQKAIASAHPPSTSNNNIDTKATAKTTPNTPNLSLEEAVAALVSAYNREDSDTRPLKLRKLVGCASFATQRTLASIGCAFTSAYADDDASATSLDADASPPHSYTGRTGKLLMETQISPPSPREPTQVGNDRCYPISPTSFSQEWPPSLDVVFDDFGFE